MTHQEQIAAERAAVDAKRMADRAAAEADTPSPSRVREERRRDHRVLCETKGYSCAAAIGLRMLMEHE
jgi:hypothetical protein